MTNRPGMRLRSFSMLRVAVVLALAVLAVEARADAAVWYVNDTSTVGDSFTSAPGASANDGLSRATPKRNIHEIDSLLGAGDSVFIDAGQYYNESNIVVTVAGVTFLGADSRTTLLDANYETCFWLRGADRTRIENVAILNADMAIGGGFGQYSGAIMVDNADSVLVVSDSFLSNATGVMGMPGSDSLTVTRSWFGSSSNWGVTLETATRAVIVGNLFAGSSLGVSARADSAVLRGNTFVNRTLLVEGADSVHVSENVFQNNSSLTLTTARHCDVVGNAFPDGTLTVNSGSSYARIVDNACTTIGGHNIDFYAESGTLSGNVVMGGGASGYGIWIRGSAYGNTIVGNTASGKRNYGFLVQGNNNIIDSNLARACQDGGFWFGSSGDTNLVTNNLADRTFGNGFLVERQGNLFRSNHARENSSHGFRVTGQANWLRQNLADSNLGYGFSVVAGNSLDRNAVRTSLVRPDSGLFADTLSTLVVARTWWFTTDSAVIRGRIWGRGRDSVVHTPFRLGIADTAANGDTVAPAAPGNLAADSPLGVIRLAWTAPTVNEDSSAVPGVALYRVFRARTADTTDWSSLAGETTGLEFRDTTAASDTDYFYRVVAVDAASVANASFYSGVVRGRGFADNEPPQASLQVPALVIKSRGVAITATLVDTGIGVASATLFARAATAMDTVTAYTSWVMARESGTAQNGTWSAMVPDTVVGSDTTRLLFLFLACTDAFGRSMNTVAETVPIRDPVYARIFVGNAQGETTEVTGSTTIASTNGSLSLRITSSIGDTVQVYRVPAGGANHTRVAFQADFADTSFTLAGPFSNGESVVVVVQDTLVNVPFAETYFYQADVTRPVVSAFTLDPVRAAVDSTGVYVRVTLSTVEANARVFIRETPDTTSAAALNDTTARYTAQTVDSSVGLMQVRFSSVAGDTVTLFASAWDQAGNVSDTVRLQFRLDRAGPLVALTAVPNNRPLSESVTVTVTVSDTTFDLGLQAVTLGVRTPNNVTDSFAMTAQGGGIYRVQVPASKIGSTAGTVNLTATALDTFSQAGTATSSFTIAAVSLQVADTGLVFAAVDTIWAQADSGYVRVFGFGDTIRVTNATSGVVAPDTLTTSSGASTDTAIVPVPLVAGLNRITIARISIAGDSQAFTRWFVADTTLPVLSSVTLDTDAAVAGSTTVLLAFSGADSFGLAAYRILGATSDSSSTFTGFSGASPFTRAITLTSDAGFKSVSVEVRDSAGNVSLALADTIELVLGAGTVIVPSYNAGMGETQALVTRALVDQVSETVTVLQGGSDTVVTYILQRGTDGDTIRVLIDFADTVRNARTIISVPDTSPLAGATESTLLISDFAAGYRTIREIVVTDSLGNPIGAAPEVFNEVRLTWSLDSVLAARKSALEVFFWDTVARRWFMVRSFDSMVNRSARDSFLNYATGDTISVVVRHFTIYAVFPAGGFTQTSVQNITVFPNPYVPHDGNLANGEAGQGFAEGIYIGNIPAGSSVEIFDIRGRRVTEMTPAEVAANTNGLVRWNARNKDNQEVASGVYLIVVKGPGGTAVRKAAVVR